MQNQIISLWKIGLCAVIWIGYFVQAAAQCPNPSVPTGYMGNVGTTAGNCSSHPLPPLCAFGSVSVNQNSPLQSVNRLNPTQLPTTNNFQIFQNPCSINQNLWTNGSVSTGAGSYVVRTGPFLVAMARTGPVALISQYNFNTDAGFMSGQTMIGFPNLTVPGPASIFFSATETNSNPPDYFSISTNVVNSDTCVLTYTPNNGAPGQIIDYNITGNVFHDVYYENLHPALASSAALVVNGTGVLMSIESGPTQYVTFGSTVTGRWFQFFVQRYNPLGVGTFVLYVVDANDDPLTFTISSGASDQFVLTLDPLTQPAYTGFLRVVSVSSNDPAPVPPAAYSQSTYFMPENIASTADTSNPPSLCPIESNACPLTAASQGWWKVGQVQSISPTGMSYYMLFPTTWANLFEQLAVKTIGASWMNTMGTNQYPTSAALSLILPPIAMANYTQANTYYQNLITQLNMTPPPYTDGSDFSTNLFTLQFDMCMASNLAADIATFQSTQRTLPTYTVTLPVNNIAVYTAHRRYVPVRADINTTATTVSWTYTLSPNVPPGDGMNKTLMCFPFWKNLSVGNFQNFIFNDTIKGTLYAAESVNGVVTFQEGGIPAWYGPSNLFIPNSLAFSGGQVVSLNTALNTILPQEVVPLPFFPESFLDPAYNAGKTCFMLAKTALYIAYFLQHGGTGGPVVSTTRPYIDNAKSILNAYLLGRTPGSSYFVADRTAGGICVNGAGGDGTWARGPNLQQSVDSGVDFGNYVYNDHHFFAGYFLLASAMITNWEMLYGSGELWIDLPVIGADNQTYKVRDLIDFLWRDTHNPFTNNPASPIYDPDLPYDRYGLPWEGHGVANGLQYQPFALGRNEESVSEDFNCWLGMNAFATLVLQTSLTPAETVKYQTVRDFSLMNLKMVSSAGIMWYKNSTQPNTMNPYWNGKNLYNPGTFLGPAIYIGQFTQGTVTNGQVNDQSAQNQTFF